MEKLGGQSKSREFSIPNFGVGPFREAGMLHSLIYICKRNISKLKKQPGPVGMIEESAEKSRICGPINICYYGTSIMSRYMF